MPARLDVALERSPVNCKEVNIVLIRMLAVDENERMAYVGLTDLDEDEDVAYTEIPVRPSDERHFQ